MDHPFVPFEVSHLSALAVTFVTSLVLVAIAQTWSNRRLAATIRWVLAALLITNWLLWLALLYNMGWLSPATILPANLCDWATIVVIITLIRPNQRTYELAYFWGFGGTLQALLTPDLAADFPDLRFLIFFALHGGVIASVLVLTLGMRMRPWLSSIPRVIAWSLVYLVTAIVVNAVFGTNFGYLMTKPTQPSLLDFLAPWPYYIGEMMLLGGGFIVLFYSPFLIWDRLARNRNASS